MLPSNVLSHNRIPPDNRDRNPSENERQVDINDPALVDDRKGKKRVLADFDSNDENVDPFSPAKKRHPAPSESDDDIEMVNDIVGVD